MGFFESFMGSSVANLVTLKAIGDSSRESINSNNVDPTPQIISQNEPIIASYVQKYLFGRALETIENREYEIALSLFKRILKLDPYHFPIYYGYLGVCLHCLEQYDSALECYDEMLDLADKMWGYFNPNGEFIPSSREHMNFLEQIKPGLSNKEEAELLKRYESRKSIWNCVLILSEKCEKQKKISNIDVEELHKSCFYFLPISFVAYLHEKSEARPDVKKSQIDKRYTLASAAICPSCKAKLKKEPTLVTECPSCRVSIYVRDLDKHRYAVTQNQANEIDREKL